MSRNPRENLILGGFICIAFGAFFTVSGVYALASTVGILGIALFVLGGDVIRGFIFAMIWGVLVGTYSSIFVASAILLRLGVKRDWSKPDSNAGNQFANVDA